MRESKKELIIFYIGFILAFIYWRLKLFFYYQDERVPFIRGITGLTIHHYHFGLLILTIFLLLYLFYKKSYIFLWIIGFGLGSTLDSFMSRLFSSHTRIQEIVNYNANFLNTLFFFLIIIMLGVIFYFIRENIKITTYKY